MSTKLAAVALTVLAATGVVTAHAEEAVPAAVAVGAVVEAEEEQNLQSSCKSTTEQVGPCSVHFSVCYGFHKFKWRYTATACASGICATSGHTKSGKGAAEEAAKNLFAKGPACAIPTGIEGFEANEPSAVALTVPAVIKLEETEEAYDPRSLTALGCKKATEQIATCKVEFKVCYGFHGLKWRYTATACASGKCGSSGRTKSAKGAAEDAAKDLFAKGPACAIPPAQAKAEDASADAVVAAPPKMKGALNAVALLANTEIDAPADDQLTSSCKSTTEQVATCSVEFKVCYGFYKRKWRYTATACASGKCGSSGHTKSAKGAAEEAAQNLFAQVPACAIPPSA